MEDPDGLSSIKTSWTRFLGPLLCDERFETELDCSPIELVCDPIRLGCNQRTPMIHGFNLQTYIFVGQP